MVKICSYCNLEKDIDSFDKSKRSNDGFCGTCKSCRKIIKQKSENKKQTPPNIKEKTCKKCGETKAVNCFGVKLSMSDGYRNVCNICRNLSAKEYYNNKEKTYEDRVKQKLYMRERRKKLSNNEDYKEKRNKNNRLYYNKVKNKGDYKIKKAWRRLLTRSVKNLKHSKIDNTINELGYSYEDLKKRIECQFQDGMSWDNYGEWHIDHKKPLSLFNENTSPKTVNSLSNLQPLWKIDNLKKGSNMG